MGRRAGPGRPIEENARRTTITVPVTWEQKTQLREMAEARGATVGSFIRSVVFNKQDELVAC